MRKFSLGKNYHQTIKKKTAFESQVMTLNKTLTIIERSFARKYLAFDRSLQNLTVVIPSAVTVDKTTKIYTVPVDSTTFFSTFSVLSE